MVYPSLIQTARTVFKSETDSELGDRMLVGAYIYLALVFVQSYMFPAPYGKFTTSSVSLINRVRSIEFPARISWIMMEVPSFLVSFSAILHLMNTSG